MAKVEKKATKNRWVSDPDGSAAHFAADKLVPKHERILRQMEDARDFRYLKATNGFACGQKQTWNMRRAAQWKI